MATSENRTDHAADDAETVSATNIAGAIIKTHSKLDIHACIHDNIIN